MKKLLGLFGVCLAILFMAGCESDDSPDEITFLNASRYWVTVTVRSTVSDVDYRFTLEPNGGETKYVKALIAPLSYTYTPTATVSDHYDDDAVVFKNRY